MAFVTTPRGFYAVRFMLGLAESGTFPGLWYYFTHFFPGNRLTIPYTISELGVKSSQVVSAPIAAALLSLGGILGVKDWQWLFFLEGVPPVILGVYIWFRFPGDPKHASWLSKDESSWLTHEIAKYETGSEEFRKQQGLSWLWCQFKEVVRVPGLWIMTLVKFLKDLTTNVTLFWTPLIIQTMLEGHSLSHLPHKGKTCSVTGDGEGKHSNVKIALLTTIPFALAMVVGMTNGWHSQKVGERKYHMSILYMAGGAIFVLMPWVTDFEMPWAVIFGMICLIGAISGAMGAQGILISLVTTYSGASKAVGLAVFNSVSNLGGYFGPQITGWMLNAWGSYTPVIIFLAGTLFASGMIAAFLRDPLDKVPDAYSKRAGDHETA